MRKTYFTFRILCGQFQVLCFFCPKPDVQNPKSIESEFYSAFRIPLKPGCRSTFTELDFTGRIFGNMLFELFAPQTLKGVATTIQGFRFGKIGRFTAQIAKL